MTSARLSGIICLAILLVLVFASINAAIGSPSQSVQVDGMDTPVQLPVFIPPVKEIEQPEPTVQELRIRAEAGDVNAMVAYGFTLQPPRDFSWDLKAAEGGNPKAMMIVANSAAAGATGHGKDLALSAAWLNKALQVGRQALIQKDIKVLGLLLEGNEYHGNDETNVLDAPTKTQYALTIGRAGGFEIEDIFKLVEEPFPGTPEKIKLLQNCSSDGHPWCTHRLANDYLNGDDGLIEDRALGIKLLTKLAQAGYYYFDDEKLSQAERIQLWKTAAEHGDILPAISLACAYRDGDGVPKSPAVAAALLQSLIQRPDIVGLPKGMAIAYLADMYADGKSFPVSDSLFLRVINSASSMDTASRKEVRDWLVYGEGGFLAGDYFKVTDATRLFVLKSIAEGTPPFNDLNDAESYDHQYRCALLLGDLYSSGQKMKQSYADAMTWYQKAEQIATSPTMDESNYDGAAAIKVGMLYEKGLGVPQNSSTAMSWYQKAVDGLISHSASPSQMMQLLNSVQLSKESADRLVSSIHSSAEAGDPEAQLDLGKLYYGVKNYSEAVSWFEKCGGDGCNETLAEMYMQGQGVTRDPAKAAYYYQKLIDNVNVFLPRQVEDFLEPIYCGGEGMPVDRPKAFAVYKKYADQNNSFGELGVGAMYQMGWGVDQDLAEAFNWYRKAAVDKNYSSTQAKADLTRIFRDCKGTPDNFNAAVSLYEKASGGQH